MPKATVSASIATGTPWSRRRLGVAGRVGFERAQGRDALGFAVGDDEVVDRDRLLGGRVQLPVHGPEVVLFPGLGEARGGVLFGRAGGALHGADDEGDHGDDREGERAGDEAATPLHLRRKAFHC